ncbi:DUF3822 family protein [Flavobacteriales bacterium]|nr:DUF3822 family protein [Flavobacteriales bacterium]
MDTQQNILFVSNGSYFLYENNSSKEEIENGQLNNLRSISSENAIAYIDGEHFNLIPQSIFDESSIDNYLELTSTELKGTTPVSNKIDQIDSTILWTLNENIKKTIIVKSPGIDFRHLLEVFINEPVAQTIYPEIKIRITKDTVYILCYLKGKLQLANRFIITGEDDIIYYTLLCTEHVQINKEITRCSIKGFADNNLTKKINKFFRKENIHINENYSFQSFIS